MNEMIQTLFKILIIGIILFMWMRSIEGVIEVIKFIANPPEKQVGKVSDNPLANWLIENRRYLSTLGIEGDEATQILIYNLMAIFNLFEVSEDAEDYGA